jgi:transcriptional regulator with XRE-family HTH domain
MSIGDRLREERDRLGMNQTDFAALTGVSRRSQSNYEGGERSPDADYLAAIAKAGADVTYILTGVRVLPLPQAQPAAPTKAQAEPQEKPATEGDPLARRKAQIKTMVDQIDDPRGLDEIQEEIQKVEWVKTLERRVAELERKAG